MDGEGLPQCPTCGARMVYLAGCDRCDPRIPYLTESQPMNGGAVQPPLPGLLAA